MKLGIIGIVGQEMTSDFRGTLTRLHEMGYQGVEAIEGRLADAGDLAFFRSLGLEHLTVSAGVDDLRERLSDVRDQALATGAKRVSVWWSKADDRDVLLGEAELYDRAGKSLAQDGLRLCYHHHDHEFRNVFDGVTAFDLLATHTDPAHVAFTIDVGWAAVGGADPAELLRRMRGRVPAIHAKDFADLSDRASFTAVGTGAVDFGSVLPAAEEAGVEWVVVEQDQLRRLSAIDTALASALNLRERGVGA